MVGQDKGSPHVRLEVSVAPEEVMKHTLSGGISWFPGPAAAHAPGRWACRRTSAPPAPPEAELRSRMTKEEILGNFGP